MNAKQMLLPVAAVLAMIMAACSSSTAELSYLPAKGEGDSDWGMIGPDGEFLFQDEFDNCPSAVVNGFFKVYENGGYSVYKAEKHPKILGDLEGLKGCGLMTEGVMPVVRNNGRIEYVGSDGEVVFTLGPVDGHEVTEVQGFFTSSMAVFRTDDEKSGAINPQGKVVVAPEWERLSPFFEGYAVALDNNGRNFVIDQEGNIVIEVPEDITYTFGLYKDGFMAVEKGDACGFLDLKGNFNRVPSKVKNIRDWNGKVFLYENTDGKKGVSTMDGETVIRARYNRLFMLPDGNFIGKKNSGDEWTILNDKGEEVEDCGVDCRMLFDNSFILSVFSTGFELIGRDGDEYEFMRFDGRETASVYLDRIELDTDLDYVRSDYFDADNVVNAFVAPADEAGYGDYELGAPVSRYAIRDAEDYRYATSMDFDDVLSGFRYSVNVSLVASERVVYDSTPYESFYTWVFNPSAHVEEVEIVLETDADDDSLLPKVVDRLAEKNFNKVSESDGKVFMTAGANYVIAGSDSDGVSLNFMTLGRASYYEQFGIAVPEESADTVKCEVPAL